MKSKVKSNEMTMLKQSRVKSVSQLIKPFPGQWVALSKDDTYVVSVAKSFEAVLNKARRKGESCPHIVKPWTESMAATPIFF